MVDMSREKRDVTPIQNMSHGRTTVSFQRKMPLETDPCDVSAAVRGNRRS